MLLGALALLLLTSNKESKIPPIIPPVALAAEPYHPTQDLYIPFTGPLPVAIRQECRDVGIDGYFTGRNKCPVVYKGGGQ